MLLPLGENRRGMDEKQASTRYSWGTPKNHRKLLEEASLNQ